MMSQYTSLKLYEDAFLIKYDWKRWLNADLYRFHDLQCKEFNAPVTLQMGFILPFVAALVGPKTRGRFFSKPSVLNLFWINVAASGSGKSQCKERLISEPLEYVLGNCGHEQIDFEVNKFTAQGKT